MNVVRFVSRSPKEGQCLHATHTHTSPATTVSGHSKVFVVSQVSPKHCVLLIRSPSDSIAPLLDLNDE